jgi:uncharacterized membrane protein YfcA
MFLILPLTAFVGFLIGAVGIGGVLLIPTLQGFAQMDIHAAAATALFTFLFAGALGTILFHQRGSIDWRISLPICVGGFAFSFVGAEAGAFIDSKVLNVTVASIIILSGACVFLKGRMRADRSNSQVGTVALFFVGAGCGFSSGLSGAGGPVFLVPVMLVLGFSPLLAIGSGQVLQLVSASSGSVGNFLHGFIDFRLAALIAIPLLYGVIAGVHVAHRIPTEHLKRAAGVLCLLAGIAMLRK